MSIVNGRTDHGPRTKTDDEPLTKINHRNSHCHFVTDELKKYSFRSLRAIFL